MVIYMIFILFNRLYEFNKRYKEFNKTFFYLGFTVFLSLLVIMVLSKFIGIEDLKGMIIEESIDYNILWLEDWSRVARSGVLNNTGTFFSWALNNMFLNINIYNLVLIGFFLCVSIYYIVLLLKK